MPSDLQPVKIIECPRDAMQGIPDWIETDKKVNYLNQLLKVGFDTLDFGSFVSAKAIPQLADTALVLEKLDILITKTKLLAIVANLRGAIQATDYEQISYIGFPLSASETFQQRNTHKSITEALAEIDLIQNLCLQKNKTLVVYISMGFGNPYGDEYNPEIVAHQTQQLNNLGIEIISFADTVASASSENITALYQSIVPEFPHIEFGVHLHTRPEDAISKLEAAFQAGCRRFDGALRGFGGCPMAADTLTGNMPTELIVNFLKKKESVFMIDEPALANALLLSEEIFVKKF
jgi:hydroxymethylglutaryl-CoA lyase